MNLTKPIRITLLVVFLVAISLGGINLLGQQVITDQPVTLTPSPTPSGFGFGGIVSQPLGDVKVQVGGEQFPKVLRTYQILPGPFELFSGAAAQVIAQNLGFTQEANANLTGNLYIYNQGTKTLSIDRLAGTINFSENLSALSLEAGSINESNARSKVRTFFKALDLDQDFFDWSNAKVVFYTVIEGIPRKMEDSQTVDFLEFVPNLKIGDYALDLPMPVFIRVDKDGKIIGLSFWYPHLDWENPREVNLLSFAEAKERVESGKGFQVSKEQGLLDSVRLNEAQLVYRVLPEYLSDFGVPRFLEPIFVFEGEKAKVYLSAVGE